MTATSERAPITAPPFVQLHGFLTDEEHARLVEFARAHHNDLVASGVLNEHVEGGVDHDVRKSKAAAAAEDMIEPFTERLHALLPHMRKEVGLGWFQLAGVEAQFTAHGDGDFFGLHNDSGSVATRSRQLTFVYYFHVPPRGFDGGELVFYDWVEEDGWLKAGDIAHVLEPADNSIVFFPSHAFHEVKPVRCDSGDTDDFRFTVNGWFHAEPTADDIAAVDALTNAQRVTVPHFTDTGFEVLDTPDDLHRRMAEAWQRTKDDTTVDLVDGRLYHNGLPYHSPVDLDPNALLDELKAEHEAWAGVGLEPTAVFGFRNFLDGQTQRPHTLRVESHVITSVYCIDIDNDDRSWPVYIVDHDGNEHTVELGPGQTLRYESASCPVGHVEPLAGSGARYLMVHYRPTDWTWTERDVWQEVSERYPVGPDQ